MPVLCICGVCDLGGGGGGGGQFGSNPLGSGLRLPPQEPSAVYTHPAGGQNPGNRLPGHLPVRRHR